MAKVLSKVQLSKDRLNILSMQITKVEGGTARNGNPLKKVYLSEKVNSRDMIFLFSDHTRFEEVKEGMELGPDEVVADGQYIKLIDPDAGVKGKGGSRTGAIKQAMNEKAANIAVAQENKGEAIKLAATLNHAVAVAVALNASSDPMNEEQIKEKIVELKAWFYVHWEDIDTSSTPPF